MNLNKVRLGDICDKILSGGTPSTETSSFWNGSIPWVTSADITGNFSVTPKKCITEKANANILPAGNVLVVTRVGLGKVVANDSDLAFSQDIQGLIVSKNVDIPYLVYCLSQKVQKFKMVSRGATIKGVTRDDLVNIEIPLPDLPTQKHIASILDKADALRQQNRQLLNYYDELLQSTFIEMFGDPVKNTKGWETMLFGLVGRLDRGVSKHRPRNASALLGGLYPLIQTGDVANSNGYISSYKSTYSDLGLRQSRLWKKGTLCITIAANIAKTGILTFDACFPDSVVGFVPDEKLSNNEYVQCWLSFLQKILEDSAPESAQKNINLEILRNLPIPVPPLKLQQHFAEIVQMIEIHKEEVRTSIRATDTLFGGLLTRYFNNSN